MNPETIALKEIRYPNDIEWWPMALGWWIILGIIISVIVVFVMRFLRNFKRNKKRRIALNELNRIRNDEIICSDVSLLTNKLSILIRKSMLAYESRDTVAGLVGEEWLEFLDQNLEEKYFSQGVGRSLVLFPYQNPKDLISIDVAELCDLVEKRITTPITPGADS